MTRAAAAEAPDAAALFAMLADDLRAYLRRRVSDDGTADDLVQEVFLRVHQHHDELRDGDRVAPWVFRIAHNVVVDHHRSRARSPTSPQVELPDADPDEEDTAAQVLGRWLLRTIDSLPPRYREALTLTEIHGLDQKVAAAELGLSYSGFKSRVQRGRAELRRLLVRCCELELDRTGHVMDYHCRRGTSCCKTTRAEGDSSRRPGAASHQPCDPGRK